MVLESTAFGEVRRTNVEAVPGDFPDSRCALIDLE